MRCEDSTNHLVGAEEIKKLLRDGDISRLAFTHFR